MQAGDIVNVVMIGLFAYLDIHAAKLIVRSELPYNKLINYLPGGSLVLYYLCGYKGKIEARRMG